MPPPNIVVVVPMYNEARNITAFIDRLVTVACPNQMHVTAIFVDDGSSDDSVAQAASLLTKLPGSEVVELSRNFGKEAALLAGMDAALSRDFDAAILMDADLQHPPEVIPKLVAEWQAGTDVVVALRASRISDPLSRRLLTKLFYKTINLLVDTPIRDGEGDFRLLSRNAVKALCSLREQHRFTKGFYSWIGFPHSKIVTDFDSRKTGETKYKFSRLVSLGVNGITSFSAKPLRIAFYFGGLIGLFSLIYALIIAFETFAWGKQVPGYASLFCTISFLGGLQLMSIGLLGEYVGRTYIQAKLRPPYIIRRIIKGGEAKINPHDSNSMSDRFGADQD